MIKDKASGKNNAPRCIFLPYRDMAEQIIKAVALYGRKENYEAFLLRFGLLDDPNWYLGQTGTMITQ